jgi:H+/Cl- antiporter ClcA
MISGLMSALKTSTEFFISLGIILVFVAIFFPSVLKGVQKTSRRRIVALFIINLLLGVILSVAAFCVYVLITKNSFDNLDLYLLFTLVFSVSLNLSLVVNIRREISKAKKSMSFIEAVQESVKENTRKILGVVTYCLLFLLAIVFLVSGEVGIFAGLLFASFFICCLISAFSSPYVCRLSERMFK